jgi:glutamine amidotransferase
MNVQAVIVAAGGANFGSLQQACRRIGVDAAVSAEPARIAAATHVILPGVGAAAQAMQALRDSGLDRVLAGLTQPLLGICLGMQLLFEASEEAPGLQPTSDDAAPPVTRCLGLLPGAVHRLPAAPSWPHMGWNRITLRQPAHALFDGLDGDDWFYFVHGYAAASGAHAIALAEHGRPFAAAVARGNVHGVQFHPEKSAAAGRRLLRNFFALT